MGVAVAAVAKKMGVRTETAISPSVVGVTGGGSVNEDGRDEGGNGG